MNSSLNGEITIAVVLTFKQLQILRLNNTKDFNGIRSRYVRKEYTPTDQGNEVMVLQFIFLFLLRPIFQETSAEIDVKNCQC